MEEDDDTKLPIPTVLTPSEIIRPEDTHDIELARENIIAGLEITNQAIQDLATLASQSGDSNTYSSLAALLNVHFRGNKDLIAIQNARIAANSIKQAPNVVNQTLILTTAEFQKLMADEERKFNKKK